MNTYENELIINHMKLAYNLAWKYYNYFQQKLELDDLKSVALEGLIRAAKKYNATLNISFCTYAYRCIRNQLIAYYRNNKKYLFDSSLEDTFKVGKETNLKLESILMDNDNLYEYMENNELITLLYKYISDLPIILKDVLILKLQGNTQIQISKKLGISQTQVSIYYNEAINLLRNRFKINRGGEL